MPLQHTLDDTYLKMAQVWGSLSSARRKQVGCLVVKDGQIISDGYNGTPAGFDNTCEFVNEGFLDRAENKLQTKPEVLHAESNAITKLAKGTQSSIDSTVYITLSPCFECSKLMIQSGIKRVVYLEEYRFTNGVDLLKKAGIEVCHLTD